MDATPFWGIPFPELDDSPHGPNQIQEFAEYLEGNPYGSIAFQGQGTLANRPDVEDSKQGQEYFVRGDPDSDNNSLKWVRTNSGWVAIRGDVPDHSITNVKLADDSVDNRALADGSVYGGPIPDNAIIKRMMADAAVGLAELDSTVKPSEGAANATETLRALGTSAGKALAGNSSLIPTQDENDALVGTSTPSGTNPYVNLAEYLTLGRVTSKLTSGEESRTNTAYGTLTTPDEVTVTTTKGIIRVAFMALIKESVASASRVAIFIDGNQLKGFPTGGGAPANLETPINYPSGGTANYGMIVTGTGQGNDGSLYAEARTGGAHQIASTGHLVGMGYLGSPIPIYVPPGTYTISIRAKSASGSLTMKERKLWVWAN